MLTQSNLHQTHPQELEDALSNAILDEIEPASVPALLEIIKAKRSEKPLGDGDVLRCLWTSCMKTINLTGKNNQQIQQVGGRALRAE